MRRSIDLDREQFEWLLANRERLGYASYAELFRDAIREFRERRDE